MSATRTIAHTVAHTVAGGFAFPEGPRWHDGRLWFADQHDGFVNVLNADGQVHERFAVPGGPSGMGWLPNGDLLVVSMHERRMYRRDRDGALTVHADLAGLHPGHSNDMVVDKTGRAYVGNIGYDFDAGESPRPTCIAMVTPDGRVARAVDNIDCPNGAVITADGASLIVAESMGHRLTTFDIDGEGHLTNRRIFADLGEHVPDGICLDSSGSIWFASPFAGVVARVREGGEILERVTITDGQPYACMLGGAAGNDLFICCAPTHEPAKTVKLRGGHIDVARVTVPAGGGWP